MPGLNGILLQLVLKGLNGGEGLFVTQAVHHTQLHLLAVQVAPEVKKVGFYGQLTAIVQGGPVADAEHAAIRGAVTDCYPDGIYAEGGQEFVIPHLQVGGGEADIPAGLPDGR